MTSLLGSVLLLMLRKQQNCNLATLFLMKLTKQTLRLPAQIGYPKSLGGILDQVDTPQFATVIGLLLLAQSNYSHKNPFSSSALQGIVPDGRKRIFVRII